MKNLVFVLLRLLAPRLWFTLLLKQELRILTSSKYSKKFKAKWYKVFDSVSVEIEAPVIYSALSTDLKRRLDNEFPESGVLELENAYLFGEAGLLFTKEGYFLPDHSWYRKHTNELKIEPKFRQSIKRIKGLGLSLASEFSGNYLHFFLDCMARLELFYKAGFKLSDVDFIYCPKPPSIKAKHIFDKLNIPSNKCIWANWDFILNAEKLLAPSFPGARRNYPKWVPEFFRRELFVPNVDPSRRLYISRSGHSRNIINEKEVIKLLIQYRFEIYDPENSDNFPEDLSEAEVVVGPHGAGMANIVLCQPGTNIIEFIPTDHIYPYFYTLSRAANLKYGCLICQSVNERGFDAWGPSPYDFYVNIDELDYALALVTNNN